MSECLRCRDLRRQYGFAKEDVRHAARKWARSQKATDAAAITSAKVQLARATEALNDHVRIDHSEAVGA